MKKTTLLFFFIAMWTWLGWAQLVVIGPQNGETSNTPLASCSAFSYSQQLIHSDEINAVAGDLTAIDFFYNRSIATSTQNSNLWTVYVGHTTKTSFASNNDWVQLSNMTQVYSGTVTFPAPGNFMRITFDAPFAYNGTDNLVIAVDENKPGGDCTLYFGKTPNKTGMRSLYYSSNAINPDPASPPTGTGRAVYNNYMRLVGLMESCPTPSNLTVTNLTGTTADLGWTENGTATTWNIEYGQAGFTRGTGTRVNNITSNPYTINVTIGNNYDFYVQANCSADESSSWAGPFSFSTNYCSVSTTSSGDYLSAISTSGAVTDISYTATSQPTGSYSNQTNLPFHSYETQSFTLSTTYVGGSNGVNVWVDWNRNMTFDDNELVASLNNSSASKTFNITVPAGTPVGTYRMRVRGQFNALPPPCGSVNWGSTVDFNLQLVTPPTCLTPSNINMSSLGETTADVSWIPNSGETNWNVSWGLPGFTPGSANQLGSGTATGTPTFEITGLSASTRYEVYVQADCGGGDESFWGGPVAFRTTCGSVATFPYFENFDTYGTGPDAFPDCWERPVTYSGYPQIVAANPVSAPNSLRFQSAVGIPTYAVTPPFAEDIQNMRIRFWLKREGTSSGTIDVGVMSNPADLSTFELVQTINPSNNDHTEYQFNLNTVALSGTNNFVAFRHNSNLNNWYYWLDNFRAEPIPTCLEPTDLTLVGTTANSMTLGWTDHNNATSWEIQYGPVNFTLGTGTTVTATSNPFTLNIDPNEEYDFYVRAVCSPTDSSYWSEKMSSKYCEVSTSFTGDYLSAVSSAGAVSNISYTASSQPVGSYSNQTQQEFRSYQTQTFTVSTNYVGGSNGVNIWIDWDRDMTFDDDELVASLANASASKTFNITVPAGTPEGKYRMRVRGQFGSTANPPACGNVSYGSTIDFDLEIVTPPTCLAPTGLSLVGTTANSMTLGWMEHSGATQWEIQYGPLNFALGTGTIVQAGTNPFTLNIDPNNEYDFYVRSICSPTDQSFWSQKLSTKYCDVSTTSTGDYLSAISSNGAVTNFSYTASSQPAGSYSNQTQLPFRSHETQQFTISTTYVGGSNGVNIWVDWNRNMTFDDNELVASLANTNATKNFTITVPAGTAVGNYRMRVRGQFGSTANPPACGSVSYGSTIDFNLEIVTPPTCLAPTNIQVTDIDEDSARVSWTENGTATQWDVVYGLTGFNPATAGTTLRANGTPEITITDLTSDVGYDVYVKSICSDDDQSFLAGPKYFFTGYCQFTSTSTSYYITDFSTENGVLNISNMNSGRSPGGYGNFTQMRVVSYPTSGFNFAAEFNGTSTYGFNIWIDWNRDMVFDASEKVFGSGSYVSSAAGRINIPTNVQPGNYRMRIVADFLSTNPNACGANNNAEAEDYTVQIIDIPTCLPPSNLTLVQVSVDSAEVSWTSQSNETNWKVIYGIAGFDPVTEGTTIDVTGAPNTMINGLVTNTRYDVYVQAVCDEDDLSMISGPLSFWTLCTSTTVPYVQNFESAIVPELPNCTEGERIGNGNKWETLNYNSNGYRGNVLIYRNANVAANAWFYTQGIQMFAGVNYKISYKYGGVSVTWTEKMKVAYGTSPVVAQMTTQLADHPNINQGAALTNNVEFTVPADGVYYFGFHAYSNANQYNLLLDDIVIEFVDECETVTGVSVDEITATSALISWQASATETGGYEVNVYEAGADPAEDEPVATETVDTGVTSVVIDGLEADTSYDAYVTTICAGGNTGTAGAYNFITTTLGLPGMDAVKLTYYPNPVSNELTITANVSIEKIYVFNLLGQLVKEVSSADTKVILDMNNLSSGTYLLKAQVGNDVTTFKVVKE